MASSWDTSNQVWSITVLYDPRQPATKPGTPIAVAGFWDVFEMVCNPSKHSNEGNTNVILFLDVHMHYLTEDNIVNNYQSGNTSNGYHWDGPANAENPQAAINSSLTDVWHRCAGCGSNEVNGLVTVWQKPDREIWLRNGTTIGAEKHTEFQSRRR